MVGWCILGRILRCGVVCSASASSSAFSSTYNSRENLSKTHPLQLLITLKSSSAIIPVALISQRTVAICCLFQALLQMALMAQAYHVPIYFQAVKRMSAQDSGIRTLIFRVTIALANVAVGVLVSAHGIYVPFMWLGAAILVIGSGLLTTCCTEHLLCYPNKKKRLESQVLISVQLWKLALLVLILWWADFQGPISKFGISALSLSPTSHLTSPSRLAL